MARSKVFLFNGEKAAQINDSWDFVEAMGGAPGLDASLRSFPSNVEAGELYARVAAAFTAVNKSARAVAYMPFALVDRAGKDYDASSSWQNRIGFLSRPRDLFRRVRQSLIMNNRAYLRMGRNAAGFPKKLNFVVPASIRPVTDNLTGELMRLERTVNGQVTQAFLPEDPDLVRFWWLDEKTELLPNDQTEFRAMMNAAGILFYADYFVRNYYRRGGIRPTLIAMKGLVSQEKQQDVERKWSDFIRGIGRALGNMTKIFNAEAMDIKPFGDGLGDLKETPVYRQAIENIAIALGMPLSLLLSNSSSYATAEIERSQWYEDVVTWCDFIAECLNEQLFGAMGLRLEFRPEATEAGQEEEVRRAGALATFADALTKFPDADTFLGAAITFGFELSGELVEAVRRYYADRGRRTVDRGEEQGIRDQVIRDKVMSEKGEGDKGEGTRNVERANVERATCNVERANVERATYGVGRATKEAWLPTINELNELRVWREVAERRLKKGECLEFVYEPHYGGLPEAVKAFVSERLPACREGGEVREVFEEVLSGQ